jgi:peroxiredoxin (alkyl hydroperoxide reductase subunit C)
MALKKVLAAFAALVSLHAHADLKPGETAPDFTAQATQGGKVFTYTLHDALKQGPVVLYFYPAAFTPGCTIEAHKFAEAIDRYKALGASVIGVSHDPIEKLQRFSVSECRSKFPVAADADGAIMKAYDAVMPVFSSYASRTSYVIAPDGMILYAYSSLSPDKHVENTLAAVKKWKEGRR